MTIPRKVRLACPSCGQEFPSQGLLSFSTGGVTTEFEPISLGESILDYQVHSCPQCAFSGETGDFESPRVVAPDVAERIRAELAPLTHGSGLDAAKAAKKYEYAARIAEWEGKPPDAIAALYLRAAWCSREGEHGRNYRRAALENFRRADERQGESPEEVRLRRMYLIGELHRRLDDPERAREWFDRVLARAGEAPEHREIRAAAFQQRYSPGSVVHRMGAADSQEIPSLLQTIERTGPGSLDDAKRAAERVGLKAIPALETALRDDRKHVREHAALAIQHLIGHPEIGLPRLLKSLKDRDPEAREKVARSIGELGRHAKSASPVLIEAIDDPSPKVREQAAWALGEVGDEGHDEVRKLVKLLGESEPGVRGAAGKTLAALGEKAVPDLIAALENPARLVRRKAVEVLAEMGPEAKGAVPAILRLVNDPEKVVRRQVIHSLGKFGSRAQEAMPALRESLNDPDEVIRRYAAESLDAIALPGKGRRSPWKSRLRRRI